MFSFVFLRGWCVFWYSEPFKTRPAAVFGFYLSVSSFFSLSGLFVDAVFFFFLLFLSGAGETQTPRRGFGVPLVFFRPARALRLRPVLRCRHLHHGHAQPLLLLFLFVFLSSPSLVFRFGWFLGFVLVVLGFLVVFLVLVLVVLSMLDR